ncbi:MAG: ribonuclease J, partial [Bdellovibrio sp.]|nr:ribonuclease J [Bdellovibrio sp.]
KIDPTPFYGQGIDLDLFSKAGDEGVLLLLSDSTNVERHEHSMSEKIIYQKFEQLFAAAEGLTIVSMFASNVGRMGQVFELAQRLGKKVALSGRGMEQNVRLSMEAGFLKGAASHLIPLGDLEKYSRKDVIVLSTGSQGEYRSSLIRIAQNEHPIISLEQGDVVLMSSKFIPGNEKAIGRMINQLFKQGAEVLYEAVHDIHVSGHATRPELKEMLIRVRPRFFVPVHGEYRHLVHHSALAKECGVEPENVVLAVNGDVLEIDENSCVIAEHMEETRVLVEGREGNDISKLILKERRQLGEKGVVFSLMVRNAENGRIISGPEIISKGLAPQEREAQLILDAKKLVKKVVSNHEAAARDHGPDSDLQETIRIELRRFFFNAIGKKPIVLPIILDL